MAKAKKKPLTKGKKLALGVAAGAALGWFLWLRGAGEASAQSEDGTPAFAADPSPTASTGAAGGGGVDVSIPRYIHNPAEGTCFDSKAGAWVGLETCLFAASKDVATFGYDGAEGSDDTNAWGGGASGAW